MTVLLATDDIVIWPATQQTDDHGWAVPDDQPPVWQGRGALQLRAGISDPRANEGGGQGPFDPATDEIGDLYIPAAVFPADMPREGMVCQVRNRRYVLSQLRLVVDPAGLGLDCWVATAATFDTWPDGTENDGEGGYAIAW